MVDVADGEPVKQIDPKLADAALASVQTGTPQIVVGDAPKDAPRPTTQGDPRFLTPLILRYLDGRTWEIVEAFNYHTDGDRGPRNGGIKPWTIKIPAGQETDFASVPRPLWWLFSPTGSYGKAAVVHDYLYRTPGLATKHEADDVFNEAMQALGTGWFTRQTLFRGVRMFGGFSYKGGL